MNRTQALGLAVVALAGATPAGAVAPVRIVYQGHVTHTAAPLLRFARGTLVPLRSVMAALGGHLRWDPATRIAVVEYQGRRLEVDEGAHTLRLGGRTLRGLLDPQTVRGQLLVPLAAIERLYGVRGLWAPRQRLLSFARVPGGGVMGQTPEGAGEGQPTGAAADTSHAASSGFALLLSTDRPNYAVGTPVLLRLTVINLARTPVTLRFASGQRYDFEVRRAGQVVWRWSSGRMFTQAVMSLTLRPRERQVYTESWGQEDGHGQPVPAGSYEAVGILTTMGRTHPHSPPVTLRIGG